MDNFIGFVIGFMIASLFTVSLTNYMRSNQIEARIERAIAHGYAHYNDKTGEVMWDNDKIKYVVTGR